LQEILGLFVVSLEIYGFFMFILYIVLSICMDSAYALLA